MKILYAAFGLAILAGVAYASFSLGSSRNGSIPNQTSTNQSNFPSGNSSPDINPGTPDFGNPQVDSLVITSPKNGAVEEFEPFDITGTVSPNTKKIMVTAYATSTDNDPDQAPKERKTDEYTLTKFKLGDTAWTYKVGTAYGNIPAGIISATAGRFVVTATFNDGSTKQAELKLSYAFTQAEMGKPVIYLYPTKTMPVHVNVKPTNGLTVTEPAITPSGWDVVARPDGTLTTKDGKTWPYLFWEGFAANFVTPKEGFVVAKADLNNFFDAKLAILGLSAKEISDFKEFWIVRMQDKPYYFVTFVPQKTFDSYAPLTVTPTPDTIIRVFFDYRGLDQAVAVTPQVLPVTPARSGFVLTEWGGRLYR